MLTADIAHAHGHTGPTNCQDCGAPDNLHVVLWADPKTGDSGTYLQCCGCGIKAGDPIYVHADCDPDEPDGEDTDEAGPEVRIFRRDTGWVMRDFTDLEPCTTNFHREQDGRPACTAIAVWKVVEDHGMHLSIGFYCDADLPAEHQPATTPAA
ncbi:hypothetical protein [Streptomyces europaeiscabiei]|uniref:hypothetical protein n=1 Tax=Streptomyces europaeiscabiei TaxID=146819 RepID=UPI0029A78314|nr:hypothetical protein [Streptomyces europaeiscabiei]MDX3588537.1 hypothetical protein [Streptomyces europaeiscabiei]